MADSSTMNSEDILQQISEQTSELAEGEVQEEIVEELEPQEEQQEEAGEEQPAETSTEETTQEAEQQTETESSYRIKYKGKEIEIPPEKVKDYLQKGYKVEEKLRELNEKERAIASQTDQMQKMDMSKVNEDFVKQLQEDPVTTLMQFTKMVNETAEQERTRQRKIDRQFEREMAVNIPHWDAIQDGYHEYKDEGHDHKVAVAMAERDLFANLYLESKQKGVIEGEKKAVLKQKANIPSSSKRGNVLADNTSSVKDIRNMTSDQMAKELGLKFTKHPDW